MPIPAPNLYPAFNILRLSHVELIVTDLAKSRAFYVDTLGLQVTDEDSDTIYLRAMEERGHHCIVLKQGAEPRADRGADRVGVVVLTRRTVRGTAGADREGDRCDGGQQAVRAVRLLRRRPGRQPGGEQAGAQRGARRRGRGPSAGRPALCRRLVLGRGHAGA